MNNWPKEIKHWHKQPGELHDINGCPIYPGDLLRRHHFTDDLGRNHHLYHVAVYVGSAMWAYPVARLEPTLDGSSGDYLLSQDHASECTIVEGIGPGDCSSYLDRPHKPLRSES